MSERFTKEISKQEFDSVLKQYKDRLLVQRVGLSYGSIIYFLMNDSILERENMFDLTLWGWYWQIYQNNKEISNSDIITRESAENVITEIMNGAYLDNIYIEENGCNIHFSNGVQIKMKQHLQEDDSEYLFFLSVPDINDSILILTNETQKKLKIDCKKYHN